MLNQRIVDTNYYNQTGCLVLGKISMTIDLKLTDIRIEEVQRVTLAIAECLLIQKLV
jgi:hypothetical protein